MANEILTETVDPIQKGWNAESIPPSRFGSEKSMPEDMRSWKENCMKLRLLAGAGDKVYKSFDFAFELYQYLPYSFHC